ncbi:hypothetical protein [Actinomadura luteofluorescens]|uniref:hypothetical protein n=1 Tax=Actinomadura luteofluorescens TaxID=46163 RepID=UPI003D9301EA
MATRVLVVRPRPVPVLSASAPASSRPSALSSSSSRQPVRVVCDELRSLDVAVCGSCTESFTSSRSGKVDTWADAHTCDAELVALLALVTSRRAA